MIESRKIRKVMKRNIQIYIIMGLHADILELGSSSFSLPLPLLSSPSLGQLVSDRVLRFRARAMHHRKSSPHTHLNLKEYMYFIKKQRKLQALAAGCHRAVVGHGSLLGSSRHE
jgi:hypothetical protein